ITMTPDDAPTPAGGRRTGPGRAMDADRWQQVKALLNRTLECDPPSRAAFVLAESGDDADLRREVESLLEALEREGERFERPAVVRMRELPEAGEPAGMAGRRIGPYRLLREVGQGGMGVVYEAVRDDDHFEKRVAVKLIRWGAATDRVLRRFRRERQILAGLDHPNICTLFDGGVTDEGL